MLSLFSRQGRVFVKATLLGNPGAQAFLFAKLGFIFGAAVASFFGLVWLAGLFWLTLETGLAALEWQRERQASFALVRTQRVLLRRLALAALFGLVSWLAFSWLPLGLALPLALVALLVVLGFYSSLSLLGQVQDMRGSAPGDTALLYEQVREMANLTEVTGQLEMRLLAPKDLDERHSLMFYLALAQHYQGHPYLAERKWQQASECYKRALQTDPANPAARAALVICYLWQNEFELALAELSRAIAIFNGHKAGVKYDDALWNWHRNEVSSEYEQSAGLFQLGALAIALLQLSNESGATKKLLLKEFTGQLLLIPDRSEGELTSLMSSKGGRVLGVLQMLATGSFRAPDAPLQLLEEAVTLPLLSIQTIEFVNESAA